MNLLGLDLGILGTDLLATVSTGDAGGGFWMPPQSSTIAERVDWIFYFIYWICIFFFVLIVAVMIVFMIKYRRREGHSAEVTATHNTPLELTWTILPLILAIAIFYIGLDGYVDIIQAPQNSYEVNVTAKQWSWLFEHRNGASDDKVLKVPANRPVKLIMRSDDVLHAFFVPAFRVKQDIVPGRFTYVWFEAMEPGTHQIFCAEYCGTDHAQMTAFVEVLPPDVFEKEIAEDARWIDDVPDAELHKAGLRLYGRCSSCHTLDGAIKIGPSWRETHELWGKKRVMTTGEEVTIDENYIEESIVNPQKHIVANYPNQMSSFAGQLKDRELRAIVEFIKRLDEVVDAQGNPLE